MIMPGATTIWFSEARWPAILCMARIQHLALGGPNDTDGGSSSTWSLDTDDFSGTICGNAGYLVRIVSYRSSGGVSVDWTIPDSKSGFRLTADVLVTIRK